ncbi:MAG: hypothetical protein ACSHYB_06565 [Roseibacillus sp.]
MKSEFITLLGSVALALPAFGLTTHIGGTILNGDLEAATLGDFAGNHGGTISTVQNHTTGGAQSVAVDLTANNGEGQWKALCDTNNTGQSQIDIAITDDTEVISHSVWVYIPAATTFGGNTALNIGIEASSNGTAGPYPNVPSSGSNLELSTAVRNTWIKVERTDIPIPAGTTNIRTRSYNIATVQTLAGGTINASNTDSFGGTGLPMAVPGDWIADGWSGVVYLDDFELTTDTAPPPPDPNILICEDVNNGDFEAASLTPWNPRQSTGFIETTVVHTGLQSMKIDLQPANGNQWKSLGLTGANQINGPAVAGDRIEGSAWIYIPAATQFGPSGSEVAKLNFEIRSDRNMPATAGNGNIFDGSLTADLTTYARDTWVKHEFQIVATDGDQAITTINTSGWNLETVAAPATDYVGEIYIDDVTLKNIGPAPEGVLVDDSTLNGDMEGFGLSPWTFSGAASTSTDQNHTVGGSQSLSVDLTANNGNAQWKGIKSGTTAQDIIALGHDRADISAWVYIPAATTFGDTARINLVAWDGSGFGNGSANLDLTTAPRDQWVEISSTEIDISGFTTNFAINNWNLQTVTMVGAAADVPADDPTTTPQDWIDAGYEGVIYFDDVFVRTYSTTPGVGPISINSCSYDPTGGTSGTGAMTINYNTSFDFGVDVYSTVDFITWDDESFVDGAGTNLDLSRDSADPKRFFILVEPNSGPPTP